MMLPVKHSRSTTRRSTPIVRVVLYSHDSMGLGHLRRNLLIAGALNGANMNVQTLIITGTGYANAFQIPDGVDILSLPSLAKIDNGRYEPKRLHIGSDELTRFRASTIKSAIQSFRPDLFIVDKVPRGVRRELERVLSYLRTHTDTTVILGLRDILDDPKRVLREWAIEENIEALDAFYDHVWIYGDPNVYNPVDEYGWSGSLMEKAFFTGYLDRTRTLTSSQDDADELLDSAGLEDGYNLCVVGGGSDGFRLAENMAMSDSGGRGSLILTGPFMPDSRLYHLRSLADERDDVYVSRFSSEPVRLYQRAGHVVSMGGYNTVLELVALGKRPLVVPRVSPRSEQIIRARLFSRLGLVDLLHPDSLSPRELTDRLASDPRVNKKDAMPIDMGGIDRIVERVSSLSKRSVPRRAASS